ncbi:MAG: cache domain-containing protein [Sporomusaceae bacterium]|jgi:methyl-accepting chemotaxis protein|nr:cache domain-containing protein [Sporomusaceae bacterium]
MQLSFKTICSIFLVAAALVIYLIIGIATIRDMQMQIETALSEKAKSDIATALEIADYMHPGEWNVKNGELYKGEFLINGDTDVVDRIARLTNDTVTIFLNNRRVATTIMHEGSRATGTFSADYVAERVLQEGHIYVGEAEVIGVKYQTCYAPIKDEHGKIIGMFYIGVAKNLADQLKHSSTAVTVLSTRITLLIALAATCFISVDNPAAATRKINLSFLENLHQKK